MLANYKNEWKRNKTIIQSVSVNNKKCIDSLMVWVSPFVDQDRFSLLEEATTLPRWSVCFRAWVDINGPCLHEAGGQLLKTSSLSCWLQYAIICICKKGNMICPLRCWLCPLSLRLSNNGCMCHNSERGTANGLELSASNCCFVFLVRGSENRDGGGGKEKHAGSFSPLSWHLGFVEGFSPSHFPSIEK